MPSASSHSAPGLLRVRVAAMAKHGALGHCHCSPPGTCKSEGEISIFAFIFTPLNLFFSLLVLLGVKITPDSLVTSWFGFSRISGKILHASKLPVKLANGK